MTPPRYRLPKCSPPRTPKKQIPILFYRRCTIYAYFYGTNVATDNQYLLLAQLNGISQATAQFFVGTELVREEAISGEEQVAVLIDVPGNNTGVYFYIRLASASYYARMGFEGLDCDLL